MKFCSPIFATLAWVLAVVLVMQLLSGDFAGRSCQTECVQNIYWASLGFCLLGLAWGLLVVRKPRPRWVVLSNVALLPLLLMYLTVMAIGTFT